MSTEVAIESAPLPGIAAPTRYFKCRRCGRPLKSERSQQLGYGNICASKVGARPENETPTEPRDVLEPLPAAPWSADVRIWRDPDGTVRATIPRSVIWHSPDGFECGYSGSGPADLALCILNAFVPPGEHEERVECFRGTCSGFAARYHQAFKRDFIAGMNRDGGTLTAEQIRTWINERFDRAQADYCSSNNYPHFAPKRCYSCKQEIYAHPRARADASRTLITSCPFCHTSFCD